MLRKQSKGRGFGYFIASVILITYLLTEGEGAPKSAILGGGNCIKVYPHGQIAKINLHFNAPGNIFLIFPQKFERDSYFTSTTL